MYTHGYRGRGRSYRGRGGYNRNQFMKREEGSIHSKRDEENPFINGKQMLCFVCQSTKHLVAKCPYKKTTDDTQRTSTSEEAHMSINITLLSGKGELEQCYLMAECVGYGVLDTACTKTVAGRDWMTEYLASLSDTERTSAVSTERFSSSIYQF